jgi:carbon-monoxide dehydrogenase medium subunit
MEPVVPGFDFMEPDNLKEALEFISAHEKDAVALAGGTDLMRNIKLGVVRPGWVVSLARLEELSGIHEQNGGLSIGAMTCMSQLSHSEQVRTLYPALAQAAAQVGSPQVRNRGTLGGNLCNASPCADTAGPAFVFGARVVLKSVVAERRLGMGEFMTGPGQTALGSGEILTAIELPAPSKTGGSAFLSLGRRRALEITIASATASLSLDENRVERVRVCLGSVAPTPILSRAVEHILHGNEPTQEAINAAAKAAVSDVSPIDDLRASAQYRRWMVEVLTRRTLQQALVMAKAR